MVLVSAIWGSNFVAMKLILLHMSPLVMGTVRASLAGLFLLALVRLRGIALPERPAEWRSIAVIALFMTTLSSACFALGIARVSAGLAGFLGTGVIAWPTLSGEGEALGIFFVMAAPASWALGSILMKRHDLGHVHPLAMVAVQLLMSAVGLGVLAALFEGFGYFEPTPALWLPLLYAALPALAFAFVLWTEILRRGSAVQASATAYLVPLFGVGFAAWWLGERLSTLELLGGALVISGVAAVNLPGVFRADRENALAHAVHEETS